VYSIGAGLAKTNDFKEGDRVAAFHPMMTPHGAFAEYAVAPGATVVKLPVGVSFEGTLLSVCFGVVEDGASA
jgi:NADPH:quinone reductase